MRSMLENNGGDTHMFYYSKSLLDRSLKEGLPRSIELGQTCASITMKVFYDTGYKTRNIPNKINSTEFYLNLEIKVLKATLFREGLMIPYYKMETYHLLQDEETSSSQEEYSSLSGDQLSPV